MGGRGDARARAALRRVVSGEIEIRLRGICGIGGRVGDVSAADAGEGGESVGLAAGGAEDVFDGNAADSESVGDEGAVAAPGDGFGAHEGAGLFSGEMKGAGKGGFEIGGLQVVGVATEAGIAPAGVDGIFFGVAKATEGFEVDVADAAGAKGGREGLAIELRVAAGAGDGANVDDALDAMGAEERDEIVEKAGGVADGEDEGLFLGAFARHRRAVAASEASDAATSGALRAAARIVIESVARKRGSTPVIAPNSRAHGGSDAGC